MDIPTITSRVARAVLGPTSASSVKGSILRKSRPVITAERPRKGQYGRPCGYRWPGAEAPQPDRAGQERTMSASRSNSERRQQTMSEQSVKLNEEAIKRKIKK